MDPVLVSACLVGRRCRYDGADKLNPDLLSRLDGAELIPVCPEEEGGLPTPRPRAEIQDGDGAAVLRGDARVVDEHGADVTAHFLAGARRAAELAAERGATRAYLKSHSPSCGCGAIKRDGRVVPGDGVTAALLKSKGLHITAID